MATIHKEFFIDAAPDAVWAAVRDIGNIHRNLVPGFVTDCRLEGDARVVTFGNGVVTTEKIVSLDDAARRLAWSATGGRLTHHNASMQVFADGARTRAVWIADLLPNPMAGPIAQMIDAGIAAMQKTLQRG
jgi:carbon monoxide dehydrogenase subunit G